MSHLRRWTRSRLSAGIGRRDVPKNAGTAPAVERADIRFRNGHVVRGTEPSKWRWTLGDRRYPPKWDFDIVDWQPVE